MILDGNLDLHKVMKGTGNSNYVRTYKMFMEKKEGRINKL